MSWIMKAKILDTRETVVYAANKAYLNVTDIFYKWEVI